MDVPPLSSAYSDYKDELNASFGQTQQRNREETVSTKL